MAASSHPARWKIEQGVRAIFAEDTPRCVAVHVRRGDFCRHALAEVSFSVNSAQGGASLQRPLRSTNTVSCNRRRDCGKGRARDVGEQGRPRAAVAGAHHTEGATTSDMIWRVWRAGSGHRPSTSTPRTLIDGSAASQTPEAAVRGGGDAHVAELTLARMS